MKVLVAYASRSGFTEGIAEFIGEKLRLEGLQADVTEVGAVKSLVGYDAFVIGSAVYTLHWLKQARQFVSANASFLSDKPVWMFSSGPLGTKTTDSKGQDLRVVSGPREIDRLRESTRSRDHRVFFGGLDGTRLTGTMGLVYKMARRSQAARESMPEGDFRDWKEIEAWVSGIAEALMLQGSTVPSS